MAQRESTKDDFNTPAPRRNTRSNKQVIPDAPTKIQKNRSRNAKEEYEFNALMRSTTQRLFLHQADVSPPEDIIRKLLELPKSTYRTTSFKNADDLAFKDDVPIFQVEEMSPEDVLKQICKLKAEARTNGNLYPLQSRAEGSQYFSTELDSWVLRRRKVFYRSQRSTADSTNADKITSELLSLIFELCTKMIRMKLREIYYTDVNLYQSTDMVGDIANDICCMIGCTRSSLRISACEKGLFYGDVTFSVAKSDGSKQEYDGLSNHSGTTIPGKLTNITDIKSEAHFILVVEKDTVFERLVQDGFCDTFNCIIITAKGMPDVITRGFLSLLTRELGLRVFALMDCNPHGLKIYSIYRYGSKAMSYDRENLTTPGIEFLGIRYSHIAEYDIPEKSMQKMKEKDIEVLEELLALEYMKEYHDDLRSMQKYNKMVQIEAFQCHGITYIAKIALRRMLDQKLSQLQARVS